MLTPRTWHPGEWPTLLLSLFYLQLRCFEQLFNLCRDLFHRFAQRLYLESGKVIVSLARGKKLIESRFVLRQRADTIFTVTASPQFLKRRFQQDGDCACLLDHRAILRLNKRSAAQC